MCAKRARGIKLKIIEPYARLLAPPSMGKTLAHPERSADAKPIYIPFSHDDGLDLLRHIEWCARISHRSEESMTVDSWKRIVKSVVIDHGDWSVVEHASVTVDAYVDRGITHEWVRHRLFGYTQESTRFVNYEKKMPPSFIYPQVGVECEFCLRGEECFKLAGCSVEEPWSHTGYKKCPYDPEWVQSIKTVELAYKMLIAKGWRPQEARSVFPNALASRLIATS